MQILNRRLKVAVISLSLSALSTAICQAEPRLTCRFGQIRPVERSLSVECTMAGLVQGKAVALRFRDRFAGIDRLSERIYGIRATTDGDAGRLPLEIHGDGLYVMTPGNDGEAIQLTYELRLGRALDPSQYGLVSSLGPQSGILHPVDILPQICSESANDCAESPVRLRVDPPDGWKSIISSEAKDGVFEIAQPSSTLILLGQFREREFSAGSMRLRAVIAGAWGFSDEEFFTLAESIAKEQASMIESRESGDYVVTLTPFPLPLTGLRSSGICVGRSAVLMLNQGNVPQQSMGLLRRHLAHEMFHYYLPNVFNVRENFDWFWEGFTRYAAMLTLTRQKLLDLQGYLDAIGEEYESYYYNPLSAHRSLIAASAEKFSNQSMADLVYRKGTLVAALYDLEVRRQSKGALSLVDALKTLYHNYAKQSATVGNREVLTELGRLGDLAGIIRDDIEGVREIDLPERVKPYGLFLEWSRATSGKAKITVAPKASAEKKRILNGILGEGK